jgi:nitrogen regulatory protein P-II 1
MFRSDVPSRVERKGLMKLVVAIIKPHRVEDVTDALDGLDVSGITLSDVRGHGRQRGHTEVYRGSEYKVDFLPKVRLEVLVKDVDADKVANTIVDRARTGKIGDGKLWIQSVDVAVRIRTGEIGEDAL